MLNEGEYDTLLVKKGQIWQLNGQLDLLQCNGCKSNRFTYPTIIQECHTDLSKHMTF